MKTYRRLLALLLVAAMCLGLAVSAFAANDGKKNPNANENAYTNNGKGKGSGTNKKDPGKFASGEVELELLEDATTVQNGNMLRAATYAVVNPLADTDVDTDTVKYFPVTMFDYDQVKYNNVLLAQELAPYASVSDYPDTLTGMYMGNGGTVSYPNGETTVTYGGKVGNETVYYEKVTDPVNNIKSGERYVLVSACQGAEGDYNGIFVGVGLNSNNGVVSVNNNQHDQYANPIDGAAMWTVTKSNNNYRFQSGNRYLQIGKDGIATNRSAQNITVGQFTGKPTTNANDYVDVMVLSNGSYYMNKNRGYNHIIGQDNFAVYGNSASDGNAFYLYRVVTGTKEVVTPLYKDVGYALHNKWTAHTSAQDGTRSGNRIWQGLAQPKLDANGQIQFNYLDAGLFTDKEFDGKSVYTNVGMPFQYDSVKRYYTFNAKEMGAWFTGEAASNKNLHYSETPQAYISDAEDDTVAGWFPFNDSTDTPVTSCGPTTPNENKKNVDAKAVSGANHYFGMVASIDFNMTADGKLRYVEDGKVKEDDIKFEFSGDDDVWVFVDGKLVLDIGGIHNRTNGTINFAEGTWEINQTWLTTDQAEDINNGTANTAGDLWDTLGMDRASFAATNHVLTVFYLERGAGASNCEIKFNLPFKDTVNITKNATKDSNGTFLTEKEQETVNNMDFTYTIYRNGEPFANQVYSLINATTGNVIRTASTNARGEFTLKNNQTVRFITEFSEVAQLWHVEEHDPGAAFVNDETKWTSTSVTINGSESGGNRGLISNSVSVVGSDEAAGKINFLCENILDANLANPSVVTNPDRIVLDYGLPVQVNVLKNDLFRADSCEIVGIGGTVSEDGKTYIPDNTNKDGDTYITEFGKVKIDDTFTFENGYGTAAGRLEYQLNQQLTEVEEITYVVKVQSTVITHPEVGEDEVNTEWCYVAEKLYIIPATSMYYEEDFKNADGTTMIEYTGEWSPAGTSDGGYQETGLIADPDNNWSPYGSDVAYLDDSGDSNGNSMYAQTAAGKSAGFSYTFTGSGTTFFARTSNQSAYMRVQIYQGDELIYTAMRDTSYKTEDDKWIMYNIPVFTWMADSYGTYRVVVSLAKPTGDNWQFGNELYLDGFRVYEPIEVYDDEDEVLPGRDFVDTAYSNDGEHYCTVVTLREKLISDYIAEDGMTWVGDGAFVVFTDTNGEIVEASEYVSNGPKEELYLSDGQSITFSLADWDANTNRIYLGMKAPKGSADATVGSTKYELKNAADCYYNITADAKITTVDGVQVATFTITADEGALVSITNIKVTGSPKFVIAGSNVDVPGGEA